MVSAGGQLDPHDGLSGTPTREVFLTALASGIQRLLDEPTLARDPLVESLRAAGRRVDQALVVAVAGLAGVGVSSMLNAVLTSGLLPEEPLPSPGCRVVVRYGDDWSVEIRHSGGTRQPIDVEWWLSTVAHGTLDALTGAERLEIAVPYELLQAMVLVDTPGIVASDDRDTQATEDAMATADALVWVSSATDPLTASEVSALQRHGRHLAGRAVCVLTRTDALRDPLQDIPEAQEIVEETLPGYFAGIVAIDVYAGVPEAATPVLTALQRNFVARREAIKVHAARDAARAHFVRRREAMLADGTLRTPRTLVPVPATDRATLTCRKLDALIGEHLTTVARVWGTTQRMLEALRQEIHRGDVPMEHPAVLEAVLRERAARPLTTLGTDVAVSAESTAEAYARMIALGAVDGEALAAELLGGQVRVWATHAGPSWRRLNAYYWGAVLSGCVHRVCSAAGDGKKEADGWLPLGRVCELGETYMQEYRAMVDELHAGWKALTVRTLGGTVVGEDGEETARADAAMEHVAGCLGLSGEGTVSR